jgi:hypothetical protein
MFAVPPDWLRLRSRHLVILVVFLAVFVGLLVPLARIMGRLGLLSPGLLLLIGAPWLLGLLVLLIEGKSPVNFWAAPLLVSLSAPALVLWFNSMVVSGWPHTPSVSILLATLLINIALIGQLTVFLRNMCPRCCPGCRTRSMIPLRKFWGAERRTRGTFWCTSCGTAYWRTMTGEWKKERRRVWSDLSKLAASSTSLKDNKHKHFDTELRVVAPVVRTCGKAKVRPPGAPGASDSAEMATVSAGSAELPAE